MLGGGTFPNTKVIGGYDFGEDDDDPMPSDPDPGAEAHGTACAGIAAGDLGTVGDYIGGVAPGAKIYALRLSGDDGLWPTDSALAAWDWCITNQDYDPANPIMVISNSWGGIIIYDNPAAAEADNPALATAANTAAAVGITVLAASGNEYATTGIVMPAAFSNVISVGAVYDTTDEVTEYSNTGAILDILAPADPVYTTDVVGAGGFDPGDYWPDFNGTSSATPFAAGAVADLQTAAMAKLGNYLSPAKVRDILVSTGDQVTDTKVNITKPRVNLGAAISTLSFGPPVWVSDGCRLNGRVFYDFDPDIFAWYPASHNLEDDPNFVSDYYLSQAIVTGQTIQSPCVDTGSDLAVHLGMDQYTTRTDGVNDDGIVDMGYHHLFTQLEGPPECSDADWILDGIIDIRDMAILASCWLDDSAGCGDVDLILDTHRNVDYEDFVFFGSCWLVEDNEAPEPNPSEWEQVPVPSGATSITMTAKQAFDGWWGFDVMYYFEETSGNSGGTDSDWQSSNTYTDFGLTASQEYIYIVKTRDPLENESGWSDPESVTAGADIQAPSPDPMTWATVPYATSTSSISMTATTATDPSGVEYRFEETSGNPGGTDSLWQNGTNYTDSGLSELTQYCYRVMARDKSVNQNATAWSTPPACATTGGTSGNLPPYPVSGLEGDPAQWDPDTGGTCCSGHPRERLESGTGNFFHTMRATSAVDPEGDGVAYYFERTGEPGVNSGWQIAADMGDDAAREWETQVSENSIYCYTVKYRDTATLPAESDPTDSTCVNN
jgi:hypothetical protein